MDIKNNLTQFRDRLFRTGDGEPLSVISIIILLMLDIFLLIVTFSGLDAQSNLLTQPDEYIPYYCREMIVDREWTPKERIGRLQNMVLSEYRSTYRPEKKNDWLYPPCQEINDAIKAIESDRKIIRLLEKRELFVQGATIEDAKDRRIFEADLGNKFDRIINKNPKIMKLWRLIDKYQAQRDRFINELRRYRSYFSIYEILLQLLFLVPLLFLAVYWYIKSCEKGIRALISTHLLVVVLIPVFMKIVQLVINVIPEQLFVSVMAFLNRTKIIAFWYYFLMVFGVLVTLSLIYFFQKHVYSKERIAEKRIRNRCCTSCGKSLPNYDLYCVHCGSLQYRNCPKCGGQTYAQGKYCRECGGKED